MNIPGKALLILAAFAVTVPAQAGNKLIPAGKRIAVAKSAMTVLPAIEWNKLGARPGRNAETWTLDGNELNDITFYGGIENGKSLFREADKKNKPLPLFSSTMLITDVPALFENSYRIASGATGMTIDKMEPLTIGGRDGVRFTYSFSLGDQALRRKGEARAAIVNGKLYMATYEAPALYYYDRSISAFEALAASIQL